MTGTGLGTGAEGHVTNEFAPVALQLNTGSSSSRPFGHRLAVSLWPTRPGPTCFAPPPPSSSLIVLLRQS